MIFFLFIEELKKNFRIHARGEIPSSVVVNVLNCDIVVSEFELQSRYYVHFRTNISGKTMNSLIPPAMS